MRYAVVLFVAVCLWLYLRWELLLPLTKLESAGTLFSGARLGMSQAAVKERLGRPWRIYTLGPGSPPKVPAPFLELSSPERRWLWVYCVDLPRLGMPLSPRHYLYVFIDDQGIVSAVEYADT